MNIAVDFRFISLILISVAVIVMLGLGLTIPKVAGYSALLILLTSLLGLWATRKDNFPPLEKWEKWWVSAIFLYFGLISLDIFMGYGGVRDLDSPSRLILAIPVFLYIRRVDLNINIIWIASAIGAITSGIYAGYQYEILEMNRVTGMTSPIYFGQASLIFTLFSLIGFYSNKKIWIKLLLFIAIIMGIYSVFVSGSRGAWVALPIVAIALISILKKTPLSRKLGSLIILIGVLYAAYQSPQLPVKSRVNHAMNEVIAYYQEDKVETSSGYRLEMWKGAWLMTKSSNFLGVGESQYPNHIVKLIQEGEVSKSIDKFIVPHNQYLNSLSKVTPVNMKLR